MAISAAYCLAGLLAQVAVCHAFAPLVQTSPRVARLSRTAPQTRRPVTTLSEEEATGIRATPHTNPRFAKRVKQIATLGPSSCTREVIEDLFLAGADVFRLNFSHGGHEEKAELVAIIRAIEAKYAIPIAILADLQGPKLRVDVFEKDSVQLTDGQAFRFDLLDEPGDGCRVKLPHPEIIETLEAGDVLLIDDGKIRVTVTESGTGFVDTVVDVGGKISNRKGVNTPTVTLPISALTPKDRLDLEYALSINVDWIALSFVQKKEDMIELLDLVKGRARCLAKLEKPNAIENLEDIVFLSDGIMVARGDLGVEMPMEVVPVVQKRIIDACRLAGKPVIVATQMLESMIDNPTPTRAEASDVATAVYDGADAVMLSGESAAGRFPVEAVRTQQRVISAVEADPAYAAFLLRTLPPPEPTATDAITLAARRIAGTIGAKGIVVFTKGGTTVLRASKGRPAAPILAITGDPATARWLAMSWGVFPVTILPDEDTDFDKMLEYTCAVARAKGIVDDPQDLLVVTAGLPFGTPGACNVLRVVSAAGPGAWESLVCDPRVEECYANIDDIVTVGVPGVDAVDVV